MPELETSDMFAGTPFHRPTDVSMKRNLGLLLARSAGWRRVMFLDDDISIIDPLDLRRAAGALDGLAAVGLANAGMPDNSVVCHARRVLGEQQDVFLGGGALAVPTDRHDEAFFPNIYNEDWFFLLDRAQIRPVTAVGKAEQLPYDPFANPDRARHEELGDTLAEGVFAVLSRGGTIEAALSEGYWNDFLTVRRELISALLKRSGGRADVTEALKAARGRSFLIQPRECVRFLRAWQRDQTEWAQAVGGLRTGLGIAGALGHFGLRSSSTIRLNRTGPAPREPHLRSARLRLDRSLAAAPLHEAVA
jgi:glycosyltransferase involved in cell wall biosynthesis